MTDARTTIRIEEELYRRVKQRAAATGRTVGEIISDAVRLALDRSSAGEADEPDLPVFHGTGLRTGVDLSDNAGLRDRMDGLDQR